MRREENPRLSLSLYEKKLAKRGFTLIAGVDEAGRGALAGPLVAAAIILPLTFKAANLKESKKLKPATRESLCKELKRKALAYSVCIIEPQEVDRLGLQGANRVALKRAVAGLSLQPEFVLCDGFRLGVFDCPYLNIIQGDNLSYSIAAASIIAKVTRDRIMSEYHRKHPEYNFDKNKGYGTLFHLRAIERFGITPIHRLTFSPVAQRRLFSLCGGGLKD
jgi:ribonuclease HII